MGDLAIRLGVSRTVIYRAIKRGEIPHISIGAPPHARLILPVAEIDAMLASGLEGRQAV